MITIEMTSDKVYGATLTVFAESKSRLAEKLAELGIVSAEWSIKNLTPLTAAEHSAFPKGRW